MIDNNDLNDSFGADGNNANVLKSSDNDYKQAHNYMSTQNDMEDNNVDPSALIIFHTNNIQNIIQRST